MALSIKARNRLNGLWGAYDFRIIRDKHFPTESDLIENFLDYYQDRWSSVELPSQSEVENNPMYQMFSGIADEQRRTFFLDKELLANIDEVRQLLTGWAKAKIAKIKESSTIETLKTHIMFKQLHFGGQTINFGSIDTNWKKKIEIEKELQQYRPWSIAHAIAIFKSKRVLYSEMMKIIVKSRSPTEEKFFKCWWGLNDDINRPMMFPQVMGHSSGKFFQVIPGKRVFPIHFDFGFVNVITKNKILVECDSRKYHSTDSRYQADRDRQNIAEGKGWSVRRFTYEDIMNRTEQSFRNLLPDLFY